VARQIITYIKHKLLAFAERYHNLLPSSLLICLVDKPTCFAKVYFRDFLSFMKFLKKKIQPHQVRGSLIVVWHNKSSSLLQKEEDVYEAHI